MAAWRRPDLGLLRPCAAVAAATAALIGVYVGLRCLGGQREAVAVSLAWARANSS